MSLGKLFVPRQLCAFVCCSQLSSLLSKMTSVLVAFNHGSFMYIWMRLMTGDLLRKVET